MVFQEYALFPWLHCWDNIKFGLDLQGGGNKADEDARVRGLISLIGLEGFERHYPHELSGGMRQRVGLARALAIQPRVLLMDEPFAAIDAMTRELMQVELLKILSETGQTVIFITHSVDEALILGDRVVVMSRRPGRIKEILKIDLPKTREQDVRTDVRFGEMREHIWNLLRTEAIQSEQRLGAGAA
jgi:NitT/TauT family transport system ATP-binding protein